VVLSLAMKNATENILLDARQEAARLDVIFEAIKAELLDALDDPEKENENTSTRLKPVA